MLGDPACAKFVQPVEDPRLKALKDHAICALDLPVHPGMRDRGPIDPNVVFIIESKELLLCELCAIVHDDEVWDSKPMDDVEEE